MANIVIRLVVQFWMEFRDLPFEKVVDIVMSCPFRYSIYEWYILLELNNTSTQVSYKAFIITLKGFGFCILECDHSESMAVASGPWSTQFEVEQHIHIPQLTDTHDDIYTQTHTNTYMYKQTHRDKYQNTHTMKYLNTNNTPQTPNNKSSSRTDRKWLLQLWFSCESKLVTLHSH